MTNTTTRSLILHPHEPGAIQAGRQTQFRRMVKDGTPLGRWEETLKHSPFGKPGTVLYGREAWTEKNGRHYYKADNAAPIKYAPWRPSTTMPREAARIWLQVERVWVERLRDLSEADARALGMEQNPDGSWHDYLEPNRLWQDDAVASFHSVMLLQHGPEIVKANPWCWAAEFKVLSTTGRPAAAG